MGPTVGHVPGGAPTGIPLNLPASTDCTAADEYIPVTAEVRLAGVEPSVIDISTATCAQLVASRFADCWSRVSNIRVFKDNPTTRALVPGARAQAPEARPVHPTRTSPCATTPATNCRYTGPVSVDWNGFAGSAQASRFDLSIDGVDLDPPNGPAGSPNGVWTMP